MLNPKITRFYRQNRSVSTDSRKIKPGDLFFALRGPSFNGNQFAAKALDTGAGMAVVDDPDYYDNENEQLVFVEDCLKTLQDLATTWRKELSIPFIGITGTNGKTTTKELMQQVLATRYRIHATVGNLNNHIGVPLTLLSIPDDAEVAIIEMGANKLGDIKELVEIAQPDYGLLTNIGLAHLERFGDIDGVQQTKGELFDFIRASNGTAWVNIADPRVKQTAEGITKRVTFGTDDSDFRILEMGDHGEGVWLKVWHKDWPNGIPVQSRLAGTYNGMNILAAMLTGHAFGIEPAHIQLAINKYQPRMNRSQFVKRGEYEIVLDAYNANPSSMDAAIRDFFSRKKPADSILILGDMFELGPDSKRFHQELGKKLQAYPGAFLIAVGNEMKAVVDMIREHLDYAWFENWEAAAPKLKGVLADRKQALIKGSRGMKLENLVDHFPGEVAP